MWGFKPADETIQYNGGEIMRWGEVFIPIYKSRGGEFKTKVLEEAKKWIDEEAKKKFGPYGRRLK